MVKVLFAIALFLSAPAWACAPSAPPPEFQLGITTAEPRVDTSLPSNVLETMSAAPADFFYHIRIGALMAGRFTTTYRLFFADTPGCVALSRIEVGIAIEPQIYIASEHHDAACEFKSFLEHELEHVAIDEKLARDYIDEFESGVRFVYAVPSDYTMKVMPDAGPDVIKARFREQAGGVLDALMDSLMRARAEKHREFDSIAEYARLGMVCAAGGSPAGN